MSTDNPAQQVLTDDQLEDCWTRAEQDAESPEDEWLLYGRYVERAALAAAPQPAQCTYPSCQFVGCTKWEIACKRDAQPAQEPVAVRQWRKVHTAQWWDGFPDHTDGGGPYETRTLYAAPTQAAPVAELVEALRKIQRIVLIDPPHAGTLANVVNVTGAALARYEGAQGRGECGGNVAGKPGRRAASA